jgi:hypothetical protein
MAEGFGENGGGVGHHAHHGGHSHGGGSMVWWYGLLGFKYPMVVVAIFMIAYYYSLFKELFGS